MAITGDAFTTYLRSEYIPAAVQTVFWNTFFLSPDFPGTVDGPSACEPGPDINQIYDYSVSTNSEVYVRGAPMPDPDTLSSVRAYFTKDFWQVTEKVYGDVISMTQGGGTHIPINMHEKAIDACLKNMVDTASATFLTDLAAQVDSTTTLGDSALSRSTYSLASLETAHSAVLTMAVLEDTIESLQNTTYAVPSVPKESELVWLMARNQKTNVGRLLGGSTNYSAHWDAQSNAPIDGSRVHRTYTVCDVDIAVVPDMTNSEIYCVLKNALKIKMHKEIELIPKGLAEWAEAYLGVMGANLIVENVRCAAKLTGVTA